MTNDLEDRLESAIRHINTALDIDPWAQNLAVESMRMRIALMKGGQPEIIRCRDCKHNPKYDWFGCPMSHLNEKQRPETAWCWKGERKTDERQT